MADKKSLLLRCQSKTSLGVVFIGFKHRFWRLRDVHNLLSQITKLHKDYNFILNYPIEVARENTIAKEWFSSIYSTTSEGIIDASILLLLKVSLMQFLIWAYRQLTIAS